MRPRQLSSTDPQGVWTWSDYPGIWPCRVVDNDDPRKVGRVRCRIFQIHGDEEHIPDEALPWVPVLSPVAGLGHGALALPETGTDGWVAFYQGNHRFPLFLGAHYGAPKGASDVPGDFFRDYPDVRGYVDPAGFKVLFNAKQRTLRIEDAHGNLIRFNAAGEAGEGGLSVEAEAFSLTSLDICTIDARDSLVAEVDRDLIVNIGRDAVVTIDGKSTIHAKDDVKVDALKDVTVSSRTGDITIEAEARDIRLKARSIEFETTTGDIRLRAGGRVVLDG